MDGSQVEEQKGVCLVFPPVIQYRGLAVTPHLPPLLSADGCSVPSQLQHMQRGLTFLVLHGCMLSPLDSCKASQAKI